MTKLRESIIGVTGRIGSALAARLPEAEHLTRKDLDLLSFAGERDIAQIGGVPWSSVVYLCAGANGAKACEGSQDAFRINVDAPIEIARIVTGRGGFLVFISSMSVEWLDTAYQRQKLAAETVLRAMPDVGIVRAGRVVPGNIADLCDTLIRVGRGRVAGVTRWGNDDIAYQR